MKKNKSIFLLSLVALVILSCSTDDKFSGSPVGNMTIETLTGTISTPAMNALTGQEIDFTASLPVGKTFSDTVTVEVTTLRSDGGRIRDYFDIMPNQTSVTDKIEAVGGLVFNTTFELSMTAIKLKTEEPGKHYLMTSNKIDINTGSTSIQEVQSDRLQIKLTWLNPLSNNKFRLSIDRPTLADVLVTSTTPGLGKIHSIKDTGTTNSAALSTALGDYIFSIGGDGPGTLLSQPFDMPYRLVLVYPNGKVDVYEGFYNGLTDSSPLVPVLKVTKEEPTPGNYVYTSSQL